MTEGQEKFYHFILEHTEEKNKEDAKNLMDESFRKQKDGTFDRDTIMKLIPKIISLIKEEAVEDVKKVMKQFADLY